MASVLSPELKAHPRCLPAHPYPAKAGAGFKPEHLAGILEDAERVGFFEVHAENYMGGGGAPHAMLARLRQDYPVSVHGVGLSIGGPGALDVEHLQRLKLVVDRYAPILVSEHLAWSSHDSIYFNDLLPVPYTAETLVRVVQHLDQVQSALGRQILLENPSTYVTFTASTMSETDFIGEVRRRSGCGLLLDVNNVFVSATNHGYAPLGYLHEFPLQHVQEIHLAGHAADQDDDGAPLLIDAHDRPVAKDVWTLFEAVVASHGPVATLIEWDNDVPDWPVLKHEAHLADAILQAAAPASTARGKCHAG